MEVRFSDLSSPKTCVVKESDQTQSLLPVGSPIKTACLIIRGRRKNTFVYSCDEVPIGGGLLVMLMLRYCVVLKPSVEFHPRLSILMLCLIGSIVRYLQRAII